MRSATIVRHDGSKFTAPVPQGLNGPWLLRCLNKANRGEALVGLTEREMAWIADVNARVLEREEAPA